MPPSGASEADSRQWVESVPRIGRFVVLQRIGLGAMGEVYSAYDAELDRKVAIKLLRRDARASERGTARLLREALALARLSHPNVVQIYDVGQFDGAVFIAMEYIEGRDLSHWLAESFRSWRDVVEVFVQAGQGLVAAHVAGLVHRDFKPENVMVGVDGRVRVLDFSVASAGEPQERSLDLRASGVDLFSSQPHTITGDEALIGTPAYMAPEQLRRRPADAASDQYSFCVTLHEALYARRPFVAPTIEALLVNMDRGLRAPTEGPHVPGKIYRILARGLASEPRERHASMRALLDELRRATRKLSPWLWASFGVTAAAAGALAWATVDAGAGACRRGAEQMTGVWDAGRKANLNAAFVAAPIAYARATIERVEPLLDSYAEAWIGAYTQSCLAHREGEISAERLDQRMSCLRARRGELRALVDVLTEGSASAVENASRAAGALTPVDRCDEDAAVRPPPPGREAEVQELGQELARVKAELDAGLYDRGLERSATAVTRARALGYEPMLAEALNHHGMLLDQAGRFVAAEAALMESQVLADASGDDLLRALTLANLVLLVGDRQGRRAEGMRLAQQAWGALRRVGGDPLVEKWLLVTESSVLRAQGELKAARERLERALVLADAEVGETAKIAPLSGLGSVSLLMKDMPGARRSLEEAVEIARRELGPAHPKVALLATNLAGLYQQEGRLDEAEKQLREALQIVQTSLGDGHPTMATILDSLGLVRVERKDYAAAVPLFERARDILAASLGPRHRTLMPVTLDLLETHLAMSALQDAHVSGSRAIAIWEASGRDVALDDYLAELLLKLVERLPASDSVVARHYVDVCLAISRRRDLLPMTVRSLAAQARLDLAASERSRALESLEQAGQLLDSSGPEVDRVELASVRLDLARGFWAVGQRERAVGLAEAGARGLPEGGPEEPGRSLSAWLAAARDGKEPPTGP